MPPRRPSASTGHINSASNLSSSRIHRSIDSHAFASPGPHGAPYASSGLSTSPQQKVVQILVNRLKNKLPVNSGSNICMTEADEALQQAIETLVEISKDSADIIGWALAELLERLAKPTDPHGHRYLEILQSQLMLLKVLCVVLASRWRNRPDHPITQLDSKGKAPMSSASLPGSPSPSKRSRQSSYEQLSSLSSSPWIAPAPLDENCAKYILSVMVVFLRQTAHPESILLPYDNLNFYSSFHDFETTEFPGMPSPIQTDPSFGLGVTTTESTGIPRPRANHYSGQDFPVKESTVPTISLPQHFKTYEKTSQMLYRSSLSLTLLIAKFVGRILYHLSASNWSVVLARIRAKIHVLASNSEENPDVIDLQLMSHSILDRPRLVQLLQELSSLLVNMKGDAHIAIAAPLRSAVWNWIDFFPDEHHESLRSRGKLEGAPERVYDLLYNVKDVDKASVIWPALTALMCASSLERIAAEFSLHDAGIPKVAQRPKDRNFVELLTRYIGSPSRFSEVAIVCLLDFARGASRAELVTELPWYSSDIAHELKTYLLTYRNKRPFWESDELDVAVVSAALAAVFRILPEEDGLSLFKTCIEPEQSAAVKLCVVKACIMLTIDRHRLPWQRPLTNLVSTLSPHIRWVYMAAIAMRNNHDANGNIRKSRTRPKVRKPTSEMHEDRELLIFSIVTLWRADLPWHVLAMDELEMGDWVPNALIIWSVPSDPAMKLSTARSYRALTDQVFKLRPETPHFDGAVLWLKMVTPASLIVVSNNLISCRFDLEAQQMWMGIAFGLMECYSRQSDLEHIKTIQLSKDRVTAFAVAEIACLVSLTSHNANVSLTAARCLRLIAEAERYPGVPLNEALSEDERVKRYPIYDQLGDPKVPLVGRIAHQKRLRKLVRLMASNSPMHIAVWEECYFRCRILGESIKSTQDDDPTDVDLGLPPLTWEERQAQWQSLTLFLAAFGASVSQESDDSRALTTIIEAKYLPDQMCASKDPSVLLNQYLTHLIDLLVSDSIVTREVARDALGTELSPKLYIRVFRYLDEVVRDITQTHGNALGWSDEFSNFLDQFIAVIKALVEQVQSPDDLLTVDVMAILLSLSGFLSRFTDPACNRVRVKFCALCDSVLDTLDNLAIRRDFVARQSILEVVLDWVLDRAQIVDAEPSQQLEVNVAALRTCVRLLDRLQLQPQEAAGEDANHFVNRLFIRYQKLGFRLLDHGSMHTCSDASSEVSSNSQRTRSAEKEAEIRELIIQGFARLISANTDVGLKHSMHFAYDPNLKTRATFARVFSRVLEAGTRFDGPSPMVSKQSNLCELVKGSDLMLALAICETCPSSEVDFIIPVLLNLFDTRASLMNLLKTIIDREVAQAESEVALFRRNTTSTRLLSAFARIHGYHYLRMLITPLIQTMVAMPPGQAYDLDPTRAGNQDLKQNQKNVELVASGFLEIVTSSVPVFPSMLHEVCAHIGKAVNEVWPQAKFAALGAFMFLRFISPAIVSPEIVDVEIPKDDGGVVRRGLMVIAKIIQNLANNIFFGKEAHMISLNTFLQDNIVNVTRFLSELNKYEPSPNDDANEWLGLTYDDTDTIVLHRFFDKHADKVGKDLLSLSKPSSDGDTSATNGKRAWDNLCAALVDLGQPMEVPRISMIRSSEHEEYQALMSRFAHRDTTAVKQFFVDTAPMNNDQVPIFIIFASRLEADTVDIELLVYHILKTMMSPSRIGQPCELIIDMTGFSSSAQLPLQWLKFVTEVVPIDLESHIRAVHFLNINAVAYRYLRRLHNLSAGSHSATEAKSYASVAELSEHVPSSALAPLSYASKLEEEQMETFKDVNMRQEQQMRLPVSLDVGTTHIRLTSIKAQPMTTSLSCRFTEIISLADVSDVYNISTGTDPNEFIIRRIRHGVTLYFSSPLRDAIIKSIRTAKGSMKSVQLMGPERYSRLSNITATLLHIGMFSSTYEEEDLRQAGFELIASVCGYLNYEGPSHLPLKGAYKSRQTNSLVIQLSERLSSHAPQLTLDFLNDVALVMDKASISQKIHCLQYMNPWIKNLVHFQDPTSTHYEHSGARLRDCIRLLIELTLGDEEIYAMVQQCIWLEVNKLDAIVVNVVLDELMRSAVDGGIGSKRSEIITDTVGTLSSINVRGRILSRLRKVVGKTTVKPTTTLVDNIHWNEIAALTRLALVSGAQCRQAAQCQLFIPEIVHLVTLIASTGQTIVRLSVHGMVMNVLLSLTMGKSGESMPTPEIRVLLDQCTEDETLRMFGLERSPITGEFSNLDPVNDKLFITNQENLTRFLAQIMEVVAGSKGLLNVWRARWMSLVSSTAFQYSPAVQARAFISLGTLATSDVDDDLFYQMLVAFKAALSQSSETDTTTVVSMLRCFAKVVPALPRSSRFSPQLFWLAVALLQSAHMSYYIEAAELLRITLETLAEQGAFDERGVSASLLDDRTPLEEITVQLDRILGLSFDSSFSFSLAAIIFKGIRHSGLRESAAGALRSLLRVTVECKGDHEDMLKNPGRSIYYDALGYFIALLPVSTTSSDFRLLLSIADVDSVWFPGGLDDDRFMPHIPLQLLGIADPTTALYVASFISAMLTTSQGDDGEIKLLYGILSDIGDTYPDIIAMAYDSLHDKIKEIFANSSHPEILKSVSNVFSVAMQQEPSRATPMRGSASTLSTVDESGPGRRHISELEGLQLQGLPNSFQFLPSNQGHATKTINWISELVTRIVE